ncbi:MAG: hypothetical protein RMA76_16220 [Deltaproteobacteria bacterium]|jgi:hypothetical protein
MTDQEGPSRVVPRVEGHVEALRAAGLNTEAFFDALVGIRDDTLLQDQHREALYRLIATESFLWYLEALKGEPIDRIKLALVAQEIAEKNAAAIKKHVPGENAAELLLRAMQDDEPTEPAQGPPNTPRKAPPNAQTKLDRPAPRKPPADAKTVRDKHPRPRRPPDASTRVDRPPPKKK